MDPAPGSRTLLSTTPATFFKTKDSASKVVKWLNIRLLKIKTKPDKLSLNHVYYTAAALLPHPAFDEINDSSILLLYNKRD